MLRTTLLHSVQTNEAPIKAKRSGLLKKTEKLKILILATERE
jgi:hypothetical protein